MKLSIIFAVLLLGAMAGAVTAQTEPVKYPASVPVASDKDVARDASTNDAVVPAQSGYTRPDSKTRFKRYINGVAGPFALARSAATAGISTWRNSPEEWGPHWEGFGRRFASNVGKNAIKGTVIYGLDEALKVDSHFYRSEKRDVGSRIKNALISPVTARKANGKRVFGFPRVVGTYSSSIIAAEAWYPPRYDYKDGLRNGTISLGMNAVFNLFKEFVWKK